MTTRVETSIGRRPGCLGQRILEDGRELVLYPMVFGNLRLCLGDPALNYYEAAWCFHDRAAAFLALFEWNGQGDPQDFFKRVGE